MEKIGGGGGTSIVYCEAQRMTHFVPHPSLNIALDCYSGGGKKQLAALEK